MTRSAEVNLRLVRMFESVYYLALVVMLMLAFFASLFVARNQLNGGISSTGLALFRTPAEQRLNVVEAARVDAKRRLILIRRDDVEHLILTGGPVDLLIETGIVPQSPPKSASGPDRHIETAPRVSQKGEADVSP